MASQDAFDYNRALSRLIQLRFELRDQNGDVACPEILELERQIYAYVRSGATHKSDAETRVAAAPDDSAPADPTAP